MIPQKALISKLLKRSQPNLPLIPEPKPQTSILVLVAHPDDECLSSFGYLGRGLAVGAKVKVVIATLGEWSEAYSYLSSGSLKNFFLQLGKKRAKEALSAAAVIGLKKQDIVFLDYPGGQLQTLLNKNWSLPLYSKYLRSDRTVFDSAFEKQAVFSGEKLFELIKKIIFEFKPDVLITHSPLDVHKDHKTVYWLVKDSLEALKLNPETYFFIVHNRGFSFSGKNALSNRLFPAKRFMAQNYNWRSFELTK